jgi:hypothetical protein
MNTLKDSNPPISVPGLDCASEEPVIGVRILIPESALPAPIAAKLAPILPIGYRWGTWLLCRLLANRIGAAGIVVKESNYCFPFNSAFCLFTLAKRPAGPALAVVREELAVIGLLDWAQIAWRDHSELIWRLYYPESGIFAAPSEAEREADARKITELLEAAQKLQQEYGSSGQ